MAAVVAGSEVKRILESLGLPSAAAKFHPASPPPQASLWPDEPTFELSGSNSFSVIFHIAGALNERAADDGAVGNRDAQFITGFSGAWPVGEPGTEIVANVRKGWGRIRPFSTRGNYVNFQLADDDARVAAAYGGNYERLRRVKQAYDPDNLFRVNRNIPPAS